MTTEHTQTDVRFWFTWISANSLGWILGLCSALVVSAYEPDKRVAALAPTVLGAWLGATQWLVLRRRFRRGGLWIVATALGVSSVVLVVDAARVPLMRDWTHATYWSATVRYLVVSGVTGFLTGCMQWLVQRRAPGWWVLANALGWALTCALCLALAHLGSGGPPWRGTTFASTVSVWGMVFWLSFLVLGGPVPAAITGLALVRPLRQPAKET